jgi:hypothetical protein
LICGAAGTPLPYPLRAFSDSLREAPFSFQLFSFQLFFSAGTPSPRFALSPLPTHSHTHTLAPRFPLGIRLFHSARRGRRRPTSLRAFPDPLRAAPFSFQLFSFQLFSSAGTPLPYLASRIP